jgi:hypothetical protein
MANQLSRGLTAGNTFGKRALYLLKINVLRFSPACWNDIRAVSQDNTSICRDIYLIRMQMKKSTMGLVWPFHACGFQ